MRNGYKRIGIVSFDYDPPIGGQGVYVKNIINFLKAQKIYPFVFSTANNESKNHKKIKRFGKNNFGPILCSLIVNLKINRWIKKYKLGLIHIQTGAGGVLMLRKLNTPIITTSHLLYFSKIQVRNNPLYKFLFLLEKRTFMVSDIIIATSDIMKNQIVNEYGIDNKKVIVSYPGINLNLFRATSKIKNANKYIYVGRLDPNKRVAELTELFIILKNDNPDIELTLIGDGPQKNTVKSIIIKNNATSYIHLVSHIEPKELPEYYSEANFLILPSKYEALGIVAIEALACGTHVIIPANSGLAPLVERMGWGHSFSNFNDIKNKLSKGDLSTNSIDRSSLKKYFDEKSCAKKILDTYRTFGVEI
jgi:glycosyltransferase involved in cell wall biosynthesis